VSIVSASVPEARTPEAPARQLRVAHLVTRFTAGAGGIALRGALGLDPDRYASTILAADGGSLLGPAEDAGLEVIRLSHMAPGRGIYPREDRRGFRELVSHLERGRFDLVHTHSAKAGGLGRMAARRAGVPAVVHTFHGFPFHEFQSPLRRRTLVEIERRLGRITDYFMAAGTMVGAEAVRLKVAPPDRIRAFATVPIGDGIGPASESARLAARRRIGIPLEAKVIGTVARLDDQKAPLDMVAAIAALQRSDVYMVWVGDGELRAPTERLLERHGLSERFLLLGHRTDVAELLPAFDVFAMSSRYEGLPCAVVEAMVCGLPVVATAVNSVPEIVIAGKTGLLARPADPPSLSRALAYTLDHPDEAARMAQAARSVIGDRFLPEALGEDLMEVYPIAMRIGSRRVGAALQPGRGAR
jgi:glycosyltransferase involved in cell wall biosynthesis